MRHVLGPAALALAAVGACAACHKAPAAAAGDAGAVAGPPRVDGAQVLARVGDHTITVADYVAALKGMDEFDRVRYSAPERRRELLGEMIDVTLLADEARERGYDKDPIAQEETRQILRDAVLREVRVGVPGPDDLPEADVRAYFEAHEADFRDPERRRVAAIVLRTPAAAAAALEAASKASPAEWGGLVRARSIDPQAKADVPPDLAGDLGFVSPPGDARGSNARVPAEVRAAAFEIAEVGGVLPRVVAAGGQLYVVKLEGRVDAHERTFKDVERTIRVKLSQDRRDAAEAALLGELRKRYPVQIDEAALSQVKAQAKAAAPDAGGG